MIGQIITNGEMQDAFEHANHLRQVIATNPSLAATLQPTVDFLDRLAWKGEH